LHLHPAEPALHCRFPAARRLDAPIQAVPAIILVAGRKNRDQSFRIVVFREAAEPFLPGLSQTGLHRRAYPPE